MLYHHSAFTGSLCSVILLYVSRSYVSTLLPHDDFTSYSILVLFSLILSKFAHLT